MESFSNDLVSFDIINGSQDNDDISWEKKMSNEDIKTYLGYLPNKSNNDVWGMDLVLLRESTPYISMSFANVINVSLTSGVFEQD